MDTVQSEILHNIATKKVLDEDLKKRLNEAITEYKKNFFASTPDAHVDSKKIASADSDLKQKKDVPPANTQKDAAAGKHA
jgi:F-type H+-transporting ATPase subunit alpha